MKKILFRKVLSDFLIFFTITMVSVSTIVWVFQSVNYLDIIVDDGRDYKIYIIFSLLTIPKILSKIFPFALFFSFYFTLIKLEKNNELFIFWCHGVSKISLINFYLRFSIILLILQTILTVLLVPQSQDLARSILRNSNINFLNDFIKEKKFNDMIRDLTIHAETKNNQGKLTNIYIKKKISNNSFEITFAKLGEIKNINNNQFLILYDGQIISGTNDKVTTFNFMQSNINLEEFDSNLMKTIKTQENKTSDLIKCYIYIDMKKSSEFIKNKLTNVQNCSEYNLRVILRELYKRIIIPLYLPILILSSLFLLLTSKESINYNMKKILVFIFGFFLIILSETSLRFINESILKNLHVIFLPISIFIIIYFVLIYKLKFAYQKIK